MSVSRLIESISIVDHEMSDTVGSATHQRAVRFLSEQFLEESWENLEWFM